MTGLPAGWVIDDEFHAVRFIDTEHGSMAARIRGGRVTLLGVARDLGPVDTAALSALLAEAQGVAAAGAAEVQPIEAEAAEGNDQGEGNDSDD